MEQQHILQGLIKLGWSNRRIHRETGIHRDTISKYRKQFQNRPKVLTDFLDPAAQNGPKVLTDLLGENGQNRPNVLTDSISTKSTQLQPYVDKIKAKSECAGFSLRVFRTRLVWAAPALMVDLPARLALCMCWWRFIALRGGYSVSDS